MNKSKLSIRTFQFIISIILLFFHGLCAEKTNVALLSLGGKGYDSDKLSAFTDRLRTELSKLNEYNVLERSMMKDILIEQGFQQTGCTNSECAVEAGQLLNVEAVIIGSINYVAKTTSFDLRLVCVKTGKIINTVSHDCYDCSIHGILSHEIAKVVRKFSSFKPKDTLTTERKIHEIINTFNSAIDRERYSLAYSFLTEQDQKIMTKSRFIKEVKEQRYEYYYPPDWDTNFVIEIRTASKSFKQKLIVKEPAFSDCEIWLSSERRWMIDEEDLWNRFERYDSKALQAIENGDYKKKFGYNSRRIPVVVCNNKSKIWINAKNEIAHDSAQQAFDRIIRAGIKLKDVYINLINVVHANGAELCNGTIHYSLKNTTPYSISSLSFRISEIDMYKIRSGDINSPKFYVQQLQPNEVRTDSASSAIFSQFVKDLTSEKGITKSYSTHSVSKARLKATGVIIWNSLHIEKKEYLPRMRTVVPSSIYRRHLK